MATHHGALSAFEPHKEDWSSYILRQKYYFEANGIKESSKKKAILLSACGPATFRRITSLLTPTRLEALNYDALVQEVKDYYDPKPSMIVQRFQFNTRVRANGESIASYMAALRKIAEHCEYDDLNGMLRDRLVCGVNNDVIQRRLLAEKDLTYEKALDLAQSIEAADKNAKIIKGGATDSSGVHFSSTNAKKPNPTCYRCGGPHLANDCKCKDTICKFCKKKGHLDKVCRTKKKSEALTKSSAAQQTKKNHYLPSGEPSDETTEEAEYGMYALRDDSNGPIMLDVCINSVPIKMELDTGASLTILSSKTYRTIADQVEINTLEASTIRLKTYTGEHIKVQGSTSVNARYDNQEAVLTIHVVDGAGPDLMGRDWLNHFQITIQKVNHLNEANQQLQEVIDEHISLFNEELGCMKAVEIALQVKPDAKPKFLKARSVPYVLKQKVEESLEQLEAQGVISPVKTSKWAAPIVSIVKRSGKIRICGDFKCTYNQVSDTESYPIPTAEELFSKLAGGKYFSKLDLSSAYLQLPLAESSKPLLTINTQKGPYQFNRLPFGVNSAPAIFQRTMETLLQGLPGVSVYIDDILVTGASIEEHLANLKQVLARLHESGLRLNRDKCFFLRTQIEYLGYILDAKGLHPTEEKLKAIKNAPQPKSITELRSFLGIINYYSKFLPQLSSKLAPLYSLLRKDARWTWGCEQEKAFTLAKNALQSDTLLVHYDPSKPLILACDASQYGLGAVLSHLMEDGQERPIAYASRTLSTAEKKYSQLEKEGLAIIFGIKKFHNYVYGRHFTIQSDHQPLSFLFSELKGIPTMASSRIQRWALTLSAYHYTIDRYKAGKTLNNADALSRLPQSVTSNHDGLPGDVLQVIDHLSSTAISCASIQKWTDRDPTLSKVKRCVMQGIPLTATDDDFKPYKTRANELSLVDGCILWGARVVVPPQGRQAVLNELHDTHPGCSKMKALARCYVWWPKIDADIESTVKQCQLCQESRPSPPAAPLHPWEWPSQPWSRLHLDFAGPFLGNNYLVLVDAYSKWLDVQIMPSTTSAKTIEKLRMIFATHGLPSKIVTDNGAAFTSNEFQTFMEQNGIKHVTSAPYHPSTNGLAERAVQTFKRAIERMPDLPIQERLSKFLFTYRLTPHTTTGVAPAELLMGRRPRSLLDKLHPDLMSKVENKQVKQKQAHDSSKPVRTFNIGDAVFAENFTGSKPKWIPCTISEVTGPLSYVVQLSNGSTMRRHVDCIRRRDCPNKPAESATNDELATPSSGQSLPPLPPLPPPPPPPPPPPTVDPPPPRRSQRPRRPYRPYGT